MSEPKPEIFIAPDLLELTRSEAIDVFFDFLTACEKHYCGTVPALQDCSKCGRYPLVIKIGKFLWDDKDDNWKFVKRTT